MERCGCSIVRAIITEPDLAEHRRRLEAWLVRCGFICAPGDITLVCASLQLLSPLPAEDAMDRPAEPMVDVSAEHTAAA
jgi:hypothetical protein